MATSDCSDQNLKMSIKEWWGNRRTKYNKALIISCFVAFVIYNGVMFTFNALFSKPDPDDFFSWDLKVYFIVVQLIGYLILISVANLLYDLAPYLNKCFSDRDTDTFRQMLFNVGCRVSISLPLLVSLWLVFDYIISNLPYI